MLFFSSQKASAIAARPAKETLINENVLKSTVSDGPSHSQLPVALRPRFEDKKFLGEPLKLFYMSSNEFEFFFFP